jgi:hypothetical protein
VSRLGFTPDHTTISSNTYKSNQRRQPPHLQHAAVPSKERLGATTTTTTTTKVEVDAVRVGDGSFSFDESRQAFLFWAPNEEPPSHLVPTCRSSSSSRSSAKTSTTAPTTITSNHAVDDDDDLMIVAGTTFIDIPLAPCVYRMTDYTLAKREPISLARCVQKL